MRDDIRLAGTAFNDVIGSAQSVFSPHVIQIVEESVDANVGPAATASVISIANKHILDFEIAKLGLRQERYVCAGAAQPSASEITEANLSSKLSDLSWPLSGQ